METELCNMCMISDAEGRVLVQERLPKLSNPWSGLTFPGGHVEPGETVVASVIREVQEETGLTVSNLQNCGYIHRRKTVSGPDFKFYHLVGPIDYLFHKLILKSIRSPGLQHSVLPPGSGE